MVPWRVVDTGVGSGAYNMGVDRALAEDLAAGPVLRFYDWYPPAVSCGYGQRPEREVDPDVCRAMGVDIVRRPTGGRAVLHWEELTYCIVCDPEALGPGMGIEEIYRAIGECLVEGLRIFGAAVELERVRRSIGPTRDKGATRPCFSSAARYELKYRGRKLVGSAQRRYRHCILQHGSILLGRAHQRLPQLMRIDPVARKEWPRHLQARSIDLAACVERPVDRAELVNCLVRGFSRRLGAEMSRDTLSEEEIRRAVELAEDLISVPPVEVA